MGRIFAVGIAVVLAVFAAAGQTKKTPRPAPAGHPKPASTPVAEPDAKQPVKKNGRPQATSGDAGKAAAEPGRSQPYTYEFSQPSFPVSHVVIRHDAAGRGTISFSKRDQDEPYTDPLTVSPAALERINQAYDALGFLDSTEDYQYEKDYSHLGNMAFTLRKGGKERTARFNYTVNKNAKALADEYRRLANQYVWIFDMTVARENQPLNAPQLMDVLDGYIRRGDISDGRQLVPLLGQLSDDERIPLIARNHAARLAAQIEKRK